jgi:rubredoxin
MIDRQESRRRGYLTETIFGQHCVCPRCNHEELIAYRVNREMWRRTPIRFYEPKRVEMAGGKHSDVSRALAGPLGLGQSGHGGRQPSERAWYVDGREMDRIPLEWECGKCGVRWYVDDSPNGFRKVMLDLVEDADGRSPSLSLHPAADACNLAE